MFHTYTQTPKGCLWRQYRVQCHAKGNLSMLTAGVLDHEADLLISEPPLKHVKILK